MESVFQVKSASIERWKSRIAEAEGKLQAHAVIPFEEKRAASKRIGLLSEAQFLVLPAGVDMVHVEVTLSRRSYDAQVKAVTGKWKEKRKKQENPVIFTRFTIRGINFSVLSFTSAFARILTQKKA